MSEYLVAIPVGGTVYVSVQADDELSAIALAVSTAKNSEICAAEMRPSTFKGGIFYEIQASSQKTSAVISGRIDGATAERIDIEVCA